MSLIAYDNENQASWKFPTSTDLEERFNKFIYSHIIGPITTEFVKESHQLEEVTQAAVDDVLTWLKETREGVAIMLPLFVDTYNKDMGDVNDDDNWAKNASEKYIGAIFLFSMMETVMRLLVRIRSIEFDAGLADEFNLKTTTLEMEENGWPT